MGAQEKTERVLRDLHVLFSKAKPYDSKGVNVVVNKNSIMTLLKELNDCMYQMLEEHELNDQGREKANRQMQKQGDDIIFDASRKAEDIYAASIMYTDNALASIQQIMTDVQDSLQGIFDETKSKLEAETRDIRSNQINLKTNLNELIDTQKYLRLIDEENARLARESGSSDASLIEGEPTYSAPEIRVNTDFLVANGMMSEMEITAEEPVIVSKDVSDITSTVDSQMSLDEAYGDGPISEQLSADLDADYFAWQDEQQGADKKEKKSGKLKSLFKK